MKTEVKILHSSCCATGSPIRKHIERVASDNNIDVTVEEPSELQDTMAYGTMIFPSLVVKGKVYDYKKYASKERLLSIL